MSIKVYKIVDLDEYGTDAEVLIGDKFDVADFFQQRDDEREEVDDEFKGYKDLNYDDINDLGIRADKENYCIEWVCTAKNIRE